VFTRTARRRERKRKRPFSFFSFSPFLDGGGVDGGGALVLSCERAQAAFLSRCEYRRTHGVFFFSPPSSKSLKQSIPFFPPPLWVKCAREVEPASSSFFFFFRGNIFFFRLSRPVVHISSPFFFLSRQMLKRGTRLSFPSFSPLLSDRPRSGATRAYSIVSLSGGCIGA